MARPTALGAHIYAGGFSVGVSRHFRVLAHLEEGPYGVKSFQMNFPHIPVHVGIGNWPLKELRRQNLDLVFTNPPCAVWSHAGKNSRSDARWDLDPRVSCVHNCFKLLLELRPKVWVWESVVPAFMKGRKLVDELTARATKLGYGVTYLLVNAKWLGAPQERKRFFFVAHQVEVDWRCEFKPPLTVAQALKGIKPKPCLKHGDHRHEHYERLEHLFGLARPGESLAATWERLMDGKPKPLNRLGKIAGKPGFLNIKADGDRPLSTYLGALRIHHKQPRIMATNEVAILCGFPEDYKLEACGAVAGSLLARGVLPPVAAWLAENLARALRRNEPVRPQVRLLDLREPDQLTQPEPLQEPVTNFRRKTA